MSTLQLYGKFAANILGGEAAGDVGMSDYLTNAIRFTLHAAYTPNTDTHEAWADVSATELGTANGYTANGIAIAGKSAVYAATGITTFDMDDTTVTWTAVTGNLVFGHAILHDDTVTVGPPIKPLYGYIDTGAQTITPGNTFAITTGASGLFTATVTGA